MKKRLVGAGGHFSLFRIGLFFAILFAVLYVVGDRGGARASSAAITKAETDEAFTRGAFAFSVTWDECNAAGCKWLPAATVQPALPSYSCQGDEALDSDPDTRQVWSGGQHTANGSVGADLGDVPILTGVQGQRLCVSVIRTEQIRNPVCVAQAPVLGYDPSTCPMVNHISYRPLAAAPLTVAKPTLTPPPAPTATTDCDDARAELAAAKAKLKNLKKRDAAPRKIKRAQKRVRRARAVVQGVCK